MVLDRLHDFIHALAVFGHASSHIREEIVVAFCAEASALPVGFEDLENGVILSALGCGHDRVDLGALIETSGAERVGDHLFADLSGEYSLVDVAGALIAAEHVLALLEHGVELIDHAAL